MATTMEPRLATANARDGVDTRNKDNSTNAAAEVEETTRLGAGDQDRDGQTAAGYVYCLSNPMYEGVVKVGITFKTPEERARQLYTTGVPLPFTVEFAMKVPNPEDAEARLHNLLTKYHARVNPSREFFRVGVADVREFFELVCGQCGEWWSPTTQETEEEESEEEEEERLMRAAAPGCRDMAKCFTDGQRIRHVIGGTTVRIGVYNSANNRIMYEGNALTLYAFSRDHYRRERPDRTSENNSWKECECEINGKWVSTYALPARM